MIFALVGYKNKNTSSVSLNSPDKINLHVDGKQKQITKNGDKFDQTLFDRIKVLINIRMPQQFSAALCITTQDDIKEAKENSVEFVYDKAQTVAINNNKVQFTEIFFPLSDKWKNAAFIMENGKLRNIVGIKENLDYLVKVSFGFMK
jgi:hypothetical protein